MPLLLPGPRYAEQGICLQVDLNTACGSVYRFWLSVFVQDSCQSVMTWCCSWR